MGKIREMGDAVVRRAETMHAQWHDLIHRGLTAGAADAALDAIAAAAIDFEDVHAVSDEEEEEEEEDGWGEWGDEGKSEAKSEAKTGQSEKRSGSKTGAVVSETEARSLVVAATAAGPVAAAKVALALPYPSLRPDALAALGNVANADLDDDLTALISHAEIIPSLLSPNFAPNCAVRRCCRPVRREPRRRLSRPLTRWRPSRPPGATRRLGRWPCPPRVCTRRS